MEPKKFQTVEIKIKVWHSFNGFSLSVFNNIYPSQEQVCRQHDPHPTPVANSLCPTPLLQALLLSEEFHGEEIY